MVARRGKKPARMVKNLPAKGAEKKVKGGSLIVVRGPRNRELNPQPLPP